MQNVNLWYYTPIEWDFNKYEHHETPVVRNFKVHF